MKSGQLWGQGVTESIFSHLKFKKLCKYIIYLLARLLHSCNVKMWGICEDIRTLCSRGQAFTSLSNPKQHKHLKGTHVRVLRTRVLRDPVQSLVFHEAISDTSDPRIRLEGCLAHTLQSVLFFPPIGALKQCSLHFGCGSPTLDTVLSLSMQSQQLRTVRGLTRTTLIGFWMDFWII